MARPLKYKSADEMQFVIDDFFTKCQGMPLLDDENMPVINKNGDPVIINKKVPTVTGLALALGFTSRQALLNYQGKKQFIDTITRAKSMCEEYAESRLFDRDGARGAEFSLRCNFKWDDKEKEADKNAAQEVSNFIEALIQVKTEPQNEKTEKESGDG